MYNLHDGWGVWIHTYKMRDKILKSSSLAVIEDVQQSRKSAADGSEFFRTVYYS
jgi:hypothetical protein